MLMFVHLNLNWREEWTENPLLKYSCECIRLSLRWAPHVKIDLQEFTSWNGHHIQFSFDLVAFVYLSLTLFALVQSESPEYWRKSSILFE